jgi:hypothetical protein
MDYASIGSRTTVCSAPQNDHLTLRTDARRRLEVLLSKICKIMPVVDLDADEGQRVETLIDALDRAALIRRTCNTVDASKSDI